MLDQSNHLRLIFAIHDIFRSVASKRDEYSKVVLTLYGLKVLCDSQQAPVYAELNSAINPINYWLELKQGQNPETPLQALNKAVGTHFGVHLHLENFTRRLPLDSLKRIVIELDRLDAKAQTLADFKILSSVSRAIFESELSEEYSTPPPVNTLLAAILRTHSSDLSSVYDPACGVGGGLVAVRDALADNQVEAPASVQNVHYYGQDVNEDALFIAVWHLVISGVTTFTLRHASSLSEPGFTKGEYIETFDAVVTNPPFNLLAPKDLSGYDRYERFLFGEVSGRRSDYAFIQHSIASTKRPGVSVMLVATGILSRSGFEKDIRENMIHADAIQACVTLPNGILPHVSASVSLMLFNTTKSEALMNKIIFIDASEASEAKRGENPLTQELVFKILETLSNPKETAGYATIASLKTMMAKDYSLQPAAYIPQKALELRSNSELNELIAIEQNVLQDVNAQLGAAMTKLQKLAEGPL